MKKNSKVLLLVLLLIISSPMFSQEDCNSCLGKKKWQSEREILNSEVENLDPFNSIIKLNVKRWYNFSGGFYGTASFLKDNLLITAHHNVIRKGHIVKIKYVVNGKTVELKKKDFKIVYLKNKFQAISDIALIKIKNPIKVVPVKTHFKLATTLKDNPNQKIHLTGYPCDYSGRFLVDKQTNSSNLIYDSSHQWIGYPFYTCTGDSGGPLWYKEDGTFYLVGVHHGGNEGNNFFEDNNVSVRISPEIENWINNF